MGHPHLWWSQPNHDDDAVMNGAPGEATATAKAKCGGLSTTTAKCAVSGRDDGIRGGQRGRLGDIDVWTASAVYKVWR